MLRMFITAHASGGLANRGAAGERTRAGQATGFDASRPAPRRGESMGDYYRRTGLSGLGATARTRGRAARVVTRTRGNR